MSESNKGESRGMINFTEVTGPIKLPSEYSVVPAVACSVSGLRVPERRPALNIVTPSKDDDVLNDERLDDRCSTIATGR